MIVKLEGKLERGFAPWKAMLEGASDKLKETWDDRHLCWNLYRR